MADPSIPNVPSTVKDPQLRLMLGKVKEVLERRVGHRGEELDSSPTWRDLYNNGIVRYRRNGVIYERDSTGDYLPGGDSGTDSGGDSYDPNEDLSVPPAPTGVTLSTTVNKVLLTWNDHGTRYVSQMEIWRSDDTNVNNAVLVGVSSYQIYADVATPKATYTYWLRFVSYRGTPGPWHDIAGTTITLPDDPSAYLDLLSGQITESQLFGDLNARINLIDAPSTGLIDSLAQEAADRAAADVTHSGLITGLQTDLTAAEGTIAAHTTSINSINSTITTQGTDITANASNITQLQTDLAVTDSDLDAAETNITANATAITNLDTRVTTSEGDITVQSNRLDALEVALGNNIVVYFQADAPTTGEEGDYWVESDNSNAVTKYTSGSWVADAGPTVFEQAAEPGTHVDNDIWIDSDDSNTAYISKGGLWIPADGSQISAQSAAINDLTARVTTNEGTLTSHGSSITALQTNVTDNANDIAAETTARTALDARVTQTENDISVNSADITALDTRLTTNEGDTTSNASAISTLTTNLATTDANLANTDANVAASASDITALQASVSTLTTDVSDNDTAIQANASAISSTQATVTQQGNDITAVSSTVTQHAVSIVQNRATVDVFPDPMFSDIANNWVIDSASVLTTTEVLTGVVGGIAPTTDSNDGWLGGVGIVQGDDVTYNTLFNKTVLPAAEGMSIAIFVRYKMRTLPTATYRIVPTIQWFRSDGTHISNSIIFGSAENDTDIHVFELTGTAPADTAFAALAISLYDLGNPGPGEIVVLSVETKDVTDLEQLDVALQEEITVRATETGDLQAQQTIKIDANGYVAGFGFAVNGDAYNGGLHSSMVFNVDTFSIASPGANSLSFVVDNGNVLMDAAFIKDLVVNDAQIQNLNVDKLIGDTAAFVSANIGELTVTNAMIQDYIESDNYIPGTQGWHLNKNGNAFITGDVTANKLLANAANIVDTIHLAGNSVFLAEHSQQTVNTDGQSAVLASKTIDFSAGGVGQPLILDLKSYIFYRVTNRNAFSSPVYSLYRNGAALVSLQFQLSINETTVWTTTYYDWIFDVDSKIIDLPGPGVHTYELRVAGGWPWVDSPRDVVSSITISGGKR